MIRVGDPDRGRCTHNIGKVSEALGKCYKELDRTFVGSVNEPRLTIVVIFVRYMVQSFSPDVTKHTRASSDTFCWAHTRTHTLCGTPTHGLIWKRPSIMLFGFEWAFARAPSQFRSLGSWWFSPRRVSTEDWVAVFRQRTWSWWKWIWERGPFALALFICG